MGARYLTELAAWLRAAGVAVVEHPGWATRARSSGGYDPGAPCCVMWHHTASTAAAQVDADYCATGADDAPICNVLVDRTGTAWVLAAGATNTNGKGGPLTIPPGVVVAADTMNTRAVGVELANAGTGEHYPPAQVDAAFAVSLAIAGALGLPADAVATHYAWAPSRKIDPATAAAVEGAWAPASCTTSGTWALDDLRAELRRRSSTPPPSEDDDMTTLVRHGRPGEYGNAWVVAGTTKVWLSTNEAVGLATREHGYDPLEVDATWMRAHGVVVGPNPLDDDPSPGAAWGAYE